MGLVEAQQVAYNKTHVGELAVRIVAPPSVVTVALVDM